MHNDAKSVPLRRSTKRWLGFGGILLPIIAIALHRMSENSLTYPDFQSGRLGDKLAFALQLEAMWPVYPLMGFSFFAMSLVLFDEVKYAPSPIVLLGIFSGGLIGSWFHFLISSRMPAIELLYFHLVPIVVVFMIWATQRLSRRVAAQGYSLLRISVAIALAIDLIATTVSAIYNPNSLVPLLVLLSPLFVMLASVYFATAFGVFSYGFVFVRMVTIYHPQHRFSLGTFLLLWFPWFALFFAAIRFSIVRSLQVYATLPTQPNKCFVVSAAANGHPFIVRSKRIWITDTESCVINRQLLVFKSFEIAMGVIFPTGHRWFRAIYNRIGPMIASLIVSPYTADLLYILLKPAEWIAETFLSQLFGDDIDLA